VIAVFADNQASGTVDLPRFRGALSVWDQTI
jgi:hypothetical protein